MRISKSNDSNRLRSISHLSARRKRESGQSLVELALCMPMLLVLLAGAVEFSRMAFAAIEVSNAAMAAVQYGAQDPTNAADLTGIQTAASNDAPDVTRERQPRRLPDLFRRISFHLPQHRLFDLCP